MDKKETCYECYLYRVSSPKNPDFIFHLIDHIEELDRKTWKIEDVIKTLPQSSKTNRKRKICEKKQK